MIALSGSFFVTLEGKEGLSRSKEGVGFSRGGSSSGDSSGVVYSEILISVGIERRFECTGTRLTALTWILVSPEQDSSSRTGSQVGSGKSESVSDMAEVVSTDRLSL